MIADPARIDSLAIEIQDWNSRHARFDSPALIAKRPLAASLPQLRVPVNAIWRELHAPLTRRKLNVRVGR